jgi:hypothetical protein
MVESGDLNSPYSPSASPIAAISQSSPVAISAMLGSSVSRSGP